MLIKQTIDGASIREQDIKNSIEAINSRVLDAEARADQLSPRLLLEEKARKDLGNLISLFVKRLKKVNANATELALRLSDLECRFRLKATQIEERHILERTESPSTSTTENPIKDATLKVVDAAGVTTEESNGENGEVFEPSAPGEKSRAEAGVDHRRGDPAIAHAITPSE